MEDWDCIMRMTASWHMVGLMVAWVERYCMYLIHIFNAYIIIIGISLV